MNAPAPELTTGYDVERIRADFPVLGARVYDKPFIFLDSAASAQKPQIVIDRMNAAYAREYATVHRGIYKFSGDMTEAYEASRDTVARLLNAASPKEIVFVRGATEAINLVASSWGNSVLRSGDEIILTEAEHHSNIVPWQLLRDRLGLVLKVAPILDDGALDYATLATLIGPKTKLVAVTHMSNALGTINDIRRICDMAHGFGAKVLVDGCQAVPRMPVDVQALDCDFYVFSGHKIYGPTGIGALWARYEILEAMPPYHGGGSMIEEVSFAHTTFLEPPLRFEAGTPNFVGSLGLASAVDYVNALGLDAICAHEEALLCYAEERLRTINNLTLHGTARPKSAILSFSIKGVHPHDVGTILDRDGIAVRAGHHCAQPLMHRLGVSATVRASFGVYSTKADVDSLALSLQKVLDIFG